ncbi:type 2 isopentenyl-diphosphate Delta-isomerase [Ferroacidibacillus organovorans]|uniref:Isopentenyl-diphosphate delta-isomerase n=1 Tax=Ferroacidibacillus organovorans TaxID=1765683 RepID=A0A101XTS7_9BACL|nr:type 2 isopentenyl-diphosphate Delta-isomerase [Ferroacidibacillus organovorans]KUO97438.1 type 2 isopentenyl-diphosphate Delta-isomerase [Ferroacidibacillus organovorans]
MTREQRKWQHVELALRAGARPATSDFDDVRLVHRSLPETAVEDVRLDTMLGGLALSHPLLINAMTGGSTRTGEVNRELAQAAAETGAAMAVGSQHAALVNGQLQASFRIVRETNPHGVIFANVGADVSLYDMERAVEMIQADALQIHLNVPQELIMPEGDRSFRGYLHTIEQAATRLSVPVIVKEVGFGMARETYRQLVDAGVRIVDVGGRGGTNFAWIERERRGDGRYAYLSDHGQSTLVSLLEWQSLQPSLACVASGGIRHALDMVKALALGAAAVGVSGIALRAVREGGAAQLIEMIRRELDEMRVLMTLFGADHLRDLQRVPLVVRGEARAWCVDRGIDLSSLAQRADM